MKSVDRPLRVFLCHSSNDKPAVRELCQKLRAEAWIQPWLDEEELYPGQDWNMEIEKAVEAADAIIVCLSKGSITKEGYVQKEIKTALDYSDYKPEGTVFIIPVRLEECKPPERLSKWQYADYFQGQRDRAFERLLVSLKRRAVSLDLTTTLPVQIAKPRNDEEKKKEANQKTKENKYKSGISSWWVRSLIGIFIGLIFSIVMYIIDNDSSIAFAVPLIGCGIAGFLLYPRKSSSVFLMLGFLVVWIAAFFYLSDDPHGTAFRIAFSIFLGSSFGFPFGAIITRILYWFNVLR